MAASHMHCKPLLAWLVAVCALAGAAEAMSEAPAPSPVDPHPPVFGVDVSEAQGPLNLSVWEAAHAAGSEFAIVKATDGLNATNVNPYFSSHFTHTRQAGLLRGAYHVARPHVSDGAMQAAFFLQNGGALNSSDELSLAGTLWLETNPSWGTLCSLEDSCYGHNQHSMGMWIADFLHAYNSTTGSMPFIHTSADWYNSCVGQHGDFSKTAFLWISCIGCPSITTYPYNWTSWVVWQYALAGPLPGNQNVHDE
ncbi:hypothetical protein L7F22_027416 [Adiantum nelumboides]|nr:hypothetical protein [Adiantum nelumboides]